MGLGLKNKGRIIKVLLVVVDKIRKAACLVIVMMWDLSFMAKRHKRHFACSANHLSL